MKRRLIFTDLHGDLTLWNRIKDFISPDDELYFLGDAADRGSEGWQIIKELFTHPQVKLYLKGNHEDLLVKAMTEYLRQDGVRGESWDLLIYNGGFQTFGDWVAEGADPHWIYALQNLPTYAALTLPDGRTAHLSHAGFSSNKPIPNDELLIWDRNHINDDDYSDNTSIVVHGHTPVQHINPSPEIIQDPAPLFYDNKYAIDLSSAISGLVALFDVDTQKVVCISKEGVL